MDDSEDFFASVGTEAREKKEEDQCFVCEQGRAKWLCKCCDTKYCDGCKGAEVALTNKPNRFKRL